jgi:hypothetical protein
MKNTRYLILLSVLAGAVPLQAQHQMLKRSIHFNSGSHELGPENLTVLRSLCDSLKNYRSYRIYLKGHTDNTGDSVFNRQLSERRIDAGRTALINCGAMPASIQQQAFGEAVPVADNQTEPGKQKNRRVDISIAYTRLPVLDTTPALPSIFELYRQTTEKGQLFRIRPDRDTTLRCALGTLVHVSANSFNLEPAYGNGPVYLEVREVFRKSDMIAENLSTTSNGRILETRGMFFTAARDSMGNELSLSRGSMLTMLVPANNEAVDARIFRGNRNPHDSVMNWTLNNNSRLSQIPFRDFMRCNDRLAGGRRCRLFFCKIRNAIRNVFSRRVTNNGLGSNRGNNDCNWLLDLFEEYGVQDLKGLLEAMNAPLFEKYGVANMEALQDTLRKIKQLDLEMQYQNGSIKLQDLNYYVFNQPGLNWVNIDYFVKIKSSDKTTLTIELPPAKNVDCKLVFEKRNIVLPGQPANGKYIFTDIPKGETVWVIALKNDNNEPQLFMEKTRIDRKKLSVVFEALTLQALKEKLKVLDN